MDGRLRSLEIACYSPGRLQLKNGPLVWILASVLCSSLAHFALKLGALRLNVGVGRASIAGIGINGWLVLGGTLHAVALVFWVAGLRQVDLSVAYPFIALGFIFVALLSWLFLQEVMTAPRLMAMVLIGAGVVLIART
jgi:multidrug transporter EmrE-like cation transporter